MQRRKNLEFQTMLELEETDHYSGCFHESERFLVGEGCVCARMRECMYVGVCVCVCMQGGDVRWSLHFNFK